MVDFKMRMEGQKPTPQRVAAGRSLQGLARTKYREGVSARDLTAFVESVQKSWRILLAELKEHGYGQLDSKKFGYARNCPPVLVKASVPSEYGARLVPCKLPSCPFCHGRTVMKVQDTLSMALDALAFDRDESESSALGIQYGFFDITSTSLDGAYERLEELWAEQAKFQGTVSKRSFWMRSASFAGRLSFVGINRLSGGYEEDHYRQLHEQGALLDFMLSSEDWGGGVSKPRAMIGKYSGAAFAYPKEALYLPEDFPNARGLRRGSAVMLNALHEKKWRLYRTAGICRANGASNNEVSSTATFRRAVATNFDNVLSQLRELKDEIRQLKKEGIDE